MLVYPTTGTQEGRAAPHRCVPWGCGRALKDYPMSLA